MLLDQSSRLAGEIKNFRARNKYEPISEPLIAHFYENLLAPGDTVLDIGVHYGRHLFPMSEAVGSKGRVIGIEASKERFDAISRQILQRGLAHVSLHNVAASHTSGDATFFINHSFTGRSGLVRNPKTVEDEFEEVTVKMERLETLLGDLDALRFMKIDIEGAEAAAMAGAAELLRRFQPTIVYEGRLEASLRKYPVPPDEIGLIFELYSHYTMFGDPVVPGTEVSGWNFIAVPNRPEDERAASKSLATAWTKLLEEEQA